MKISAARMESRTRQTGILNTSTNKHVSQSVLVGSEFSALGSAWEAIMGRRYKVLLNIEHYLTNFRDFSLALLFMVKIWWFNTSNDIYLSNCFLFWSYGALTYELWAICILMAAKFEISYFQNSKIGGNYHLYTYRNWKFMEIYNSLNRLLSYP